MEVIGEQLNGLIERYRRLADSGRVELSVTPYAHPILPLLLNLECAREAMPNSPLPELEEYPGGLERAQWHIREGVRTFEKYFGLRPQGCWPAEGAVDDSTLELLEAEGFHWAASGQQVLHNSLNAESDAALPRHWLYQSYRREEGTLNCFFRDDGLSDLIGFTYADWHADDAVANLMEHLERIADETQDQPERLVSIIMDGENAWEYYPRNACYFLSALYQRLSENPRLRLTTFSESLREQSGPAPGLAHVVAGSWVYGTLSTWIGDPDKNRAWEMLADAKTAYDQAIASVSDPEQREMLERQLGICEGSDWFWWFGDYNPAETVSDFESLFRRQLSHLYQMLGVPEPEYLGHVFTEGHGDPALGGVMKQNL
jgi:alpha-amylase/alpha-mannosidase (GH57 family)